MEGVKAEYRQTRHAEKLVPAQAGSQRVSKAEGVVVVASLNTASMRRAMRAHALIVALGFAAPLLAGCETASSVFGGSSPEMASSVTTGAVPGPAAAQQPRMARIAVVPVSGAPDNVARMLSEWVAEALEKQNVSVVKGRDAAAEYYLRGFVVAARDSGGTKLTYIWDVTDKNGSKRAQRFEGDQLVKGAAGAQDPWAAVDAKVVQGLAVQTADKIVKWLPPASVVTPPIAQSTVPSTPQPQRAVASGTGLPAASTASLGRKSDGTAFVAPVVGAPGDGTTALTAAIRRELERKSVPLVDQVGAGSSRVEGRVTMGQPAGGKQVVQIDWVVTDAAGNQLGVVTQKNSIQQGTLDGAWGLTADSAASAAAVKISTLLRR